MNAVLQSWDGSSRRRALLIANPNAARVAALEDEIVAGLEAQFDVERFAGSREELGDRLQAGGQVDVAVLAGGDGTVSYMLETLVEAQVLVAVVPLGTANDLARTLELPSDPLGVVAMLHDLEETAIDVGKVNGCYFINVASVGLGSEVARQMDKAEKRNFGVLSYPVALFRAWRAARPLKTRIVLDGKTRREWVYQLGVGNGRYHGGGLAVSEHASIVDGKLNVYCVVADHPWSIATVVFALKYARHRRNAAIRTFAAERVEIRTSRSVPVNIDGEIRTQTPAKFEILPGALRILAPPLITPTAEQMESE